MDRVDNTEEKVKEKTKAYMGGLIDGEGSLSINKAVLKENGRVQYSSVVGFSNCNPLLVKWAMKHFGGTYRGRNREYSDNVSFEWYITGNKAQRSFLLAVQPYVRFKQEQVKLLFSYLDLFGQSDMEARESLHQAIKAAHWNFSVETDTLDPLSKPGRAYYSALLDGEGTITISKDRYGAFRPAVRVYNSNRALLQPLVGAWGGSLHEDTPDFWQWHINSREDIERFLLYSTPYLLGKRMQSKAMLEFVRLPYHKMNKEARQQLYDRVTSANQSRVKIQSELLGDMQSDTAGTPISINT